MSEQRLTSIHRPAKNDKPHFAAQRDRLAPKFKPTRERPLITSVSELRDFMRCRVRWHWRHQARIEPIQASENLSVGLLTHNILEAWNKLPKAKRTPLRMTKIARGIINTTTIKSLTVENKELVEAMVVGYAAWTQSAHQYSDHAIGFINGYPEEWFEVALAKDRSIILRGKIDMRFEPTARKKALGFFEYKTASQIRMSRFENSIQLPGYGVALFDLHGKDYKHIYAYPTVLRKQLPTNRVRAPLFEREEIELTRDECEMWREDARRAALDMLDASIYRNVQESCSWDCDYTGPCALRGDKSDVVHVIRSEYQPKEYRA